MPMPLNQGHTETCQAQVLAQSEVGHVLACPDCGQIHLQLKFLTLRLDPEAFRTLLGMMGYAQSLLTANPGLMRHPDQGRVPTQAALVH